MSKHFVKLAFCLTFLLGLPIYADWADEYPDLWEDRQFCECGCYPRYWIGADYLCWKIKDSPNPVPLLATAPSIIPGAPLIGRSGTKVLLGDKDNYNNWRSGARFTAGCWLDNCCCYGAEASYFFIPSGSKVNRVTSNGSLDSIFLSVPYFDNVSDHDGSGSISRSNPSGSAPVGTESSFPVAFPGIAAGSAKLKIANRMHGAELNGLAVLVSDMTTKINLLLGFRYWNFNERLSFNVNRSNLILPDEIFSVKDEFHTKNNFYGGQIGLTLEYFYNTFFINAKGRVAAGLMQQESNINGELITNDFNNLGATQTFPGGFFALPSNSCHHRRTIAAVIPEVSVNFGYQATENLRIQMGYSILYVDKILWAGKQINRNINPSQSSVYEFTANPVLVGEPNPKPRFRNSSFRAHGANVTIEYTF